MITQDQLKDFERRITELHGYLKIEDKLQGLGADITRINVD